MGSIAAVLFCLATVGLMSPAQAIVGGYQVTDSRFGFMAAIQTKGDSGSFGLFCGGSVISSRWVLTAAHCMVDTKPGEIQVAVGRDNLDEDLGQGQTLLVDRILVHPSYDSTGTHDVALVHVTAAITTAPAIALAPLGNDTLEREGAKLTVAGWGTEFFGSPLASAQLKAVDLVAVADDDCTTNELVLGFEAATEICAETLGGDSCQGDSGGPLFGRLADGRRVQVGVVSYGLGCATPGFPGVYAEANNPSIRNFITSTVGTSQFTRAPAPMIAGSPEKGRTLRARVGTWLPTPSAFKYQWYRGTNAITGATGAAYTLKAADVGRRIQLRVRAVKPGYVTTTRWSAKTVPVRG